MHFFLIINQNKFKSHNLMDQIKALLHYNYNKFSLQRLAKMLLSMILIQNHERRLNLQKYRFPATIEGALKHKKSVKFGYIPRKDRNHICGCCGYCSQTQDINLLYQTSFIKDQIIPQGQNFQLPSSIALYFTFLKMIIVYLLLRFIITDFYNLLSSYTAGTYCDSHSQCQSSIYTRLSGYNKKGSQDLLLALDILNLVMVIISIPFFIAYRWIQYDIYDKIDQQLQTQDDYTVFIQQIPILALNQSVHRQNIQLYYVDDLKQLLQNAIQKWIVDRDKFGQFSEGTIQQDFSDTIRRNGFSPQIIKSIVLCFDLHQFKTIRQTKQKLMWMHQNQNKRPFLYPMFGPKENQQQQVIYSLIEGVDQNDIRSIPQQVKLLNESQQAMNKKFAVDNSFMFNITHFVGKAFVSFQYQHYRDYILRESNRDKSFILYQMEQLKFSKAVHPDDVFWENLKIKESQRTTRVIQAYVILLMSIIFVLAFLLATGMLQTQVIFPKKVEQAANQGTQAHTQPEKKGFFQKAFSFTSNFIITTVISLIIMFVNSQLYSAIVKLTDLEKHKTRTIHYTTFMIKLVISQFINSAINWLIIWFIYPTDVLSGTGLAIKIANFIAVSGITSIPANIINTNWVFKKIGLWFWYEGLKNRTTVNKFQVELNKQYEYFKFDLSERYSYYIVQIYTAFFYSFVAPVCIPALIIVFSIQYWIDKYNLARRSSFNHNFEFQISRTALKMFELSIIIFAGGNILFSYYANQEVRVINLISVGIGLLYVIIIFFIGEDKFRWLFGSYQTCEDPTFQSCVLDGKFKSTYWQKNPATKLVRQEDITGFKSINREMKTLLDQFIPLGAEKKEII